MRFFQSIIIFVITIVIAAGCAQTEEEHAARKKAFYNRHLEKFAPAHLEFAKSRDVAVIKADGGSFTFTQGSYRNVHGPMIVEGQGVRYTNGDRSSLTEHVVHLDPGDYTVTTWVKVVSQYMCKTTAGEWVFCEKPERIKTFLGLGTSPTTGKVVREYMVETVESKMLFEQLKLTCKVTLQAMVEVRSGEIIMDCLEAYMPHPDAYLNLDFQATRFIEPLNVTLIHGESVTDEDLDVASAMKSGVVELASGGGT